MSAGSLSTYSGSQSSKKSSTLMEALAAVGHPLTMYNMAICATLGSFLFGYDTGVMNGAVLLIKPEFSLDEDWVSNIVSCTMWAAAIFSLFAGLMGDYYGRKASIMMSAIIFILGGVLMGVANGPIMLLIGRILAGVGIGIVSSVVPVYVSECSPANVRGTLTTLYQLFITTGIWVSAVIAVVFQNVHNGWRYMLGLSAIPALIQYILFVALPESPRYHVFNHKVDEAQKVLERLRHSSDVKMELDEIISAHEAEPKARGFAVFVHIMYDPTVRRTLFVGCMLQVFQQFSGINAVIYYSSTILKAAGFNLKFAIGLSLIPLTANFLATFLGMWAVEAIGRRKTLGISFVGNAMALILLLIAFLPEYLRPDTANILHERGYNLSDHCTEISNCWVCAKDDHCGFCGTMKGVGEIVNGSCVDAMSGEYMEFYALNGRCSRIPFTNSFTGGDQMHYSYGHCPLDFSYLAVTGLMFFVLAFAPGAGPMPWTINAEIYPLWSRSIATSISTMTNWICNYTVSKLFFVTTRTLTTWGTFLIFSIVCMCGAAFTFYVVPETKDRTLEEIGQDPWAAPRHSKSKFLTPFEASLAGMELESERVIAAAGVSREEGSAFSADTPSSGSKSVRTKESETKSVRTARSTKSLKSNKSSKSTKTIKSHFLSPK